MYEFLRDCIFLCSIIRLKRRRRIWPIWREKKKNKNYERLKCPYYYVILLATHLKHLNGCHTYLLYKNKLQLYKFIVVLCHFCQNNCSIMTCDYERWYFLWLWVQVYVLRRDREWNEREFFLQFTTMKSHWVVSLCAQ